MTEGPVGGVQIPSNRSIVSFRYWKIRATSFFTHNAVTSLPKGPQPNGWVGWLAFGMSQKPLE